MGSETAGIIGDFMVFASINLNLSTGTYGREYPFYECLRFSQTRNYFAALLFLHHPILFDRLTNTNLSYDAYACAPRSSTTTQYDCGLGLASKETLPSGTAINLSAKNQSTKEFSKTVCRMAKVYWPVGFFPVELIRVTARELDRARDFFRLGYNPGFDPVYAEMGLRYWNVNTHSQLARRVCGFNPRPPEETLRDTVQYIKNVQLPRERAVIRAIVNSPTAVRQRSMILRVGLILTLLLLGLYLVWWISTPDLATE